MRLCALPPSDPDTFSGAHRCEHTLREKRLFHNQSVIVLTRVKTETIYEKIRADTWTVI